jgi:hypothetical protein
MKEGRREGRREGLPNIIWDMIRESSWATLSRARDWIFTRICFFFSGSSLRDGSSLLLRDVSDFMSLEEEEPSGKTETRSFFFIVSGGGDALGHFTCQVY